MDRSAAVASARWLEPEVMPASPTATMCFQATGIGAALTPGGGLVRGSKKFWKTYAPTDRPSVSPAATSKLQWIPSQIRACPHSFAAAVKLAYERVTPGKP